MVPFVSWSELCPVELPYLLSLLVKKKNTYVYMLGKVKICTKSTELLFSKDAVALLSVIELQHYS